MLPQILQPPQYGTAVAALSIDGLGICCFNRRDKIWEIAFLREEKHQLMLGIKEVDRAGKIIKDVGTFGPLGPSKLIQFSVDNFSDVHLNDFPQGFFRAAPGFSRDGDENYDFRWIVDFVEKNGGFKKLKKPAFVVTIVRIPNALFYTKRVTTDSVLIAPDDSTDPEKDGTVLGRTNEVVGAALYAKPISTGQKFIHIQHAQDTTTTPEPLVDPLPQVPGHLYEISLTNLDTTKARADRAFVGKNYVKGDFQKFYEIMDCVNSTKLAIFAPPRGGIRSVDGDCHVGGAGGGGTGPDSLMDLITP